VAVNDTYIYSLYSPFPSYSVPPVFHTVQELEGRTGFSSLYQVDKATAEAITAAGTCAGFKGVVWSKRLWLDVDDYNKCDAVEERLREMGYGYVAYDSGGRGGHFAILRSSGNRNRANHLLPQQDRQWVQEHFPECDSTIYTHLHPFRLPGTVHQSTGKEKQCVGRASGKALELPDYKEQREAVRGEQQLFWPSSMAADRSIFNNTFIMRNTQIIPKQGERHQTLVRLIYALRDGGYSKELALWWVLEANKRWLPPKSYEEVEKAILSIYG
jgi:hypothetical protein